MVKGMILKNVKPFFDGRGCRGQPTCGIWGSSFGWAGFWGVFCSSAVAETLFLLFFTFRPWPKRYFCCFFIFRPWPKRCFRRFSSFGRGRSVVFAVFHLSAVAETRKLGVFDFPPGRKRVFRLFLTFRRGGNAEFECF